MARLELLALAWGLAHDCLASVKALNDADYERLCGLSEDDELRAAVLAQELLREAADSLDPDDYEPE